MEMGTGLYFYIRFVSSVFFSIFEIKAQIYKKKLFVGQKRSFSFLLNEKEFVFGNFSIETEN